MKKILPIIFLFLILCACTTTKKEFIEVPIPIETVKTEYIHNTKIDSIVIRDSVDRWIKGDTVFLYKEHTKYKYLSRLDTIVKIDSIPKVITREVTKEVEVNHIKWYQKTLMWTGGIALLLIVGFLIYKIKFK